MKRLALVAAVFAAVACTSKDTATTDTTSPAMAPAPAAAPADTGMKMDSTHAMMDSTAKDTTKKP